MKKITRIASAALCVMLAGVVMVACGVAGATKITKAQLDFATLNDAKDAYDKVAAADIAEEKGTITVKVASDYDMVNDLVELDFQKFFEEKTGAWGSSLTFKRSDKTYEGEETGGAFELVRTDGVLEMYMAGTTVGGVEYKAGDMKSKLHLLKGEDGKIMNYIAFDNETQTSKKVTYSIKGADGKDYKLVVKIEKKADA